MYHECTHGPLDSQEAKKKWLKTIVRDKAILRDLQQAMRAMHTGSLECYHNLLLKYCSKGQAFFYAGMVTRMQPAVLDPNNNLSCKHATTKDVIQRFKDVFPKRTKELMDSPCIYEEKT